jgi:hypothetical protein
MNGVRTVRVIYHEEEGSWWAESPDVPDWTGGGATYEEVRKLAEEAATIPWALGDGVRLDHLGAKPADTAA